MTHVNVKSKCGSVASCETVWQAELWSWKYWVVMLQLLTPLRTGWCGLKHLPQWRHKMLSISAGAVNVWVINFDRKNGLKTLLTCDCEIIYIMLVNFHPYIRKQKEESASRKCWDQIDFSCRNRWQLRVNNGWFLWWSSYSGEEILHTNTS